MKTNKIKNSTIPANTIEIYSSDIPIINNEIIMESTVL